MYYEKSIDVILFGSCVVWVRESWGIRVLYLPDLKEEAERLAKEIAEHGSTISLAIYEDYDNNDWLAGEKNGKGWIGKADRKTRKVTNEWTDGKAVEQDIKIALLNLLNGLKGLFLFVICYLSVARTFFACIAIG